MKNLHNIYFFNYPKNVQLISSTITNIMENIELYEKNYQILFSNSLSKLAILLRKENTEKSNNEILKIIRHFITSISCLEKSVSDEYVKSFNEIVDDFTENKFTIVLEKNIIEQAISLGKFGQSVINRKFSAYFCCTLILISKADECELNKRLGLLFDDNEFDVKFEIGYQIRFIAYQKDSSFCIQNLKKMFMYFLKENLIQFLSVVFDSLFYKNNLQKFNEDEELNTSLIEKLKEVFDRNRDTCMIKNEFKHISDIFASTVNYVYNYQNVIDKSMKDIFYEMIQTFIESFYFTNEIKDSKEDLYPNDFILNNFEKIFNIFWNLNLNENTLNTPNSGAIVNNKEHFLKEFFQDSIKNFFTDLKNIDLFYSNLHIYYKIIPKEFSLNKLFFEKFLFFLSEKPINQAFPFDSNINTNIKDLIDPIEFKESWLINFDKLINEIFNKQNENHILFIIKNIKQISKLFSKTKNWRIQIALLKSLCLIPKYLFLNNEKIQKFSDYLEFLFNFCKDSLSIGRNYLVEKEMMNLLTEIFLYYKNQKDFLNIIKKKLLLNESYYRRRIYCLFIESCLEKYSAKLLSDINIIKDIEIMINDQITLINTQIILILLRQNFFFENFHTLISSKINTKDKELKNACRSFLKKFNTQLFDKVKEQYKQSEEKKIFEIFTMIYNDNEGSYQKKSGTKVNKGTNIIRGKRKLSNSQLESPKIESNSKKYSSKIISKFTPKQIFPANISSNNPRNINTTHSPAGRKKLGSNKK